MLQENQVVYFTSGPVVQEATFVRYENKKCVIRTPLGLLKQRPGRVFSTEEAQEKGLLRDNSLRVKAAFSV